MKPLLLILVASALYANTCTPLTAPANGPFPAIPANGVDGISWSVARVQWTSDASGITPATNQQICYATAAEWGGTYANIPGCGTAYPHITAQTAQGVTSSSVIQGGILSNLLPSTTYHVLGQSEQGGNWCTATDQTFTTLAKPANLTPALPQSVDTTRPTLTGTHWVFGSNCGTATGTLRGVWNSGTAYTYNDEVTYDGLTWFAVNPSTNVTPGSNNVYWRDLDTYHLQDCLDKMNATTGDDLGLPPAVYKITQVSFHQSENSVAVTCSTGTSFCTQSGSAPANGAQVIFGYDQFGSAPSPLNPGIPYYVANRSGSTFQLSFTNGGTPITLLNTGSTVRYLPWPLTQPKMAIHSTAAANLLPPLSVRLGPDALAQYYPAMPELRAVDPHDGAISVSYLNLQTLTANLFFENIKFSVDPGVATSTGPIDPIAFKYPIILPITANGIVYDQCAFDWGPPPTRVEGITFEGINTALINSYVMSGDFPQPHYYVPSNTLWSVTSNTITLPASTWTYIGSAGKVSCPSTGGVVTISGSATGSIYIWINADCTWQIQMTTGLSATSTVPGMVITNAASPAYPTYSYTAPLGGTISAWSVIPFYGLTVNSGVIVDNISDNFFGAGESKQQGGGAIGLTFDAYGPVKFDNDYVIGSSIVGFPFFQEGVTVDTTVCGVVNPCPLQTVLGGVTATRSTITTDATHFFYTSANWDGGDRTWRQYIENKAGAAGLYDGNIIGPFSAQTGAGQCYLREIFTTGFIQVGSFPSYGDSSNLTFSNNSCIDMAAGISTSYGFHGYTYFPYPMKNFLIQNNLFSYNAYSQVPGNQPYRYHIYSGQFPTSGSCAPGTFLNLVQMENFVFDHNTVSQIGGCQSFWLYFNNDFPSGAVTNNIISYTLDPNYTGQYLGNVVFNNQGYLGGTCAAFGTNANTIFNCINNWKFAGNVMLAAWSNSFPGSQTDINSAGVVTAQGYYSGYTSNWPGASPYAVQNTLAGRQTQVGWFNVSASNFRLMSSSPFISGNQGSQPAPTTDGRDAGVNMDQLEQHQGKVSNVRILAKTSTTATIGFYAPDAFACGVDWTTNAWSTWTRVSGAAGSPDPRVQSVSLTGLPSHGLVTARVQCAVMQPTISVQLP